MNEKPAEESTIIGRGKDDQSSELSNTEKPEVSTGSWDVKGIG